MIQPGHLAGIRKTFFQQFFHMVREAGWGVNGQCPHLLYNDTQNKRVPRFHIRNSPATFRKPWRIGDLSVSDSSPERVQHWHLTVESPDIVTLSSKFIEATTELPVGRVETVGWLNSIFASGAQKPHKIAVRNSELVMRN
ncbi:hypothetical protein [Micromonospora sp. WMMD710]|uniref:hypothetical protein n=1 Tax=Micromonospora sp. WMMD710 TaxID=3016085 RepID=UPI0024166CCF|nr:hypothetical protein [Micromonospora sp. WMMD710]MDG4757783.1 hypothetical protein [Micromonospora sp. WMMD710]